MQSNYGIICDPDPPPVVHPAPIPAVSSSSLLHALACETARLPPRSNHREERPNDHQERSNHPEEQREPSSPPPLYNPYPYPPSWRLDRAAEDFESDFWHNRQDHWHLGLDGFRLYYVDLRNSSIIRRGIMRRQLEAKNQYEAELFNSRMPAKVEVDSDLVMTVEFAMADGQKGLPAKMLLSTRRALERGIADSKSKCFVDSPHGEKIWVRLKWPAYPDHEVKKVVPVAIRAGHKRPRRPITRLELVVALTAILTQYHSEVSTLEPEPAFAHLALGQGEGRLSLYALRMIGIRLASDGVFDLMVELDNDGEGNPAAANYERTHQGPVSFADLKSLLQFSRSPQAQPNRALKDVGASGPHVSSPSASASRGLEHVEATNPSASGSSAGSPLASNTSASNPSASSSSATESSSTTENSPTTENSSTTGSSSAAGTPSAADTAPLSEAPSSSSLPAPESENTPETTVAPSEQG